jgi:hypothetical protein
MTRRPYQGRHVTEEQRAARKEQFKQEFEANGGMKTAACRTIGMDHKTVNLWLQQDPEFRKWYEEYDALTTEAMDREVERRAMDPLDKMSTWVLWKAVTRRKRSKYYESKQPPHLVFQLVEEQVPLPSGAALALQEGAVEGEYEPV